MDDSLFQALTQLSDTLTVLACERDTLGAALTRLDTDVEHLRDEVSMLRGQLAVQVVPPCAPYSSLASETREHVDTACAAYHLGRKVQTLRKWACYENGPVRPIRIHGRLAWSVADLRRLGCR
jgi:ABC-type transporter Mla subunit MlaD